MVKELTRQELVNTIARQRHILLHICLVWSCFIWLLYTKAHRAKLAWVVLNNPMFKVCVQTLNLMEVNFHWQTCNKCFYRVNFQQGIVFRNNQHKLLSQFVMRLLNSIWHTGSQTNKRTRFPDVTGYLHKFNDIKRGPAKWKQRSTCLWGIS